MKKLIAVLLALALCAGLVACGEKTAGSESAPTTEAPSETTTTGGAYVAGDYTRLLAVKLAAAATKPMRIGMKTRMDMGNGEEDVEVTIYFAGAEKIAMDMTYSGGSMKILRDGSAAYMLMDGYAVKTAIDETSDPMQGVTAVTGESEDAKFVGGTEEIDGKTYAWEEIEGKATKMYFEQDTGVWKYTRSEDILTEITAYDNEVDESVFELPEGIEIMDMADSSYYVDAA